MARRRRAKNSRKSRAAPANQESEWLKKAPHSFIFHRGQVGRYVRTLIRDMRKVFSPFTAAKLKPTKSNTLKDFIAVSGIFSVSHFMIFTRSESSLNMRLMHVPRGPTLSFKVTQYTLAADVVTALKKSLCYDKQFANPPLLIFSHFDTHQNQMHLVRTMIQGMLPSLDVHGVKLDDVRRCVLLSYNKDEDCFDFRHYGIKAVPHGVSKQAKSLLKRKVPNLGSYSNISEYFLNPGHLSESEAEDVTDNVVELKQDLASRGCKKSTEVAVRLIEMGPRLQLKLYKIEEGISSGPVLYHAFNNEDVSLENVEETKQPPDSSKKRKRSISKALKSDNVDSDAISE